MAARAVLLLIDGLPADHVAAQADRLPALAALAARGTWLQRVAPAVPSVSFPGRAEMLTGRPPAENGVWGNAILRDGAFHKARPADVAVPSLARAVTDAGGRVVNLGFGLVRPEDTAAMADPWWQHLDPEEVANTKGPATDPIRIVKDPDGRLRTALRAPAFTLGARANAHGAVHPQLLGLACDQAMMDAAGDILCGDDPPELLLTEIAVTDAALHYHGIGSGAADFAIHAADMMVGRLVHRLAQAGRLGDTLLVVASDHGHAPIRTALYPPFLLPDALWASEGGSLHVAMADGAAHDVLARHGVRALPGDHLPAALRGQVTTFIAPEDAAFERIAAGAASGVPIVVATHGNAPGTPGDDAVAFLAGGGAPSITLPRASLRDLAPTILAALGLPALCGTAAPLFSNGALA